MDPESAIGVSGFISFNNESFKNELKYISPYYRAYFGESNYAGGFFLEVFGMLNNYESSIDFIKNNETSTKAKNFVDVAFGFGLGVKWINSRGLVFELSVGGGRNLINGNESGFPIVGKIEGFIGYRF